MLGRRNYQFLQELSIAGAEPADVPSLISKQIIIKTNSHYSNITVPETIRVE